MLLAAASLLIAPPAAQGIPDAATAASYVGHCLAATAPKGVDIASIERQGWISMNIRSGKGKPLPIAAYGRPGDMSVLSASSGKASTIQCVLLIPTDGPERAAALRETLSARFEAQPVGTVGTQMRWTYGEHRIALSPLGTAANPSGVKIQVTVEKK